MPATHLESTRNNSETNRPVPRLGGPTIRRDWNIRTKSESDGNGGGLLELPAWKMRDKLKVPVGAAVF
jgi:hypothetical protein